MSPVVKMFEITIRTVANAGNVVNLKISGNNLVQILNDNFIFVFTNDQLKNVIVKYKRIKFDINIEDAQKIKLFKNSFKYTIMCDKNFLNSFIWIKPIKINNKIYYIHDFDSNMFMKFWKKTGYSSVITESDRIYLNE